MHYRINLALVALLAFTAIIPAHGVSALKYSRLGYRIREAAYGTLAARLLRGQSRIHQKPTATQRTTPQLRPWYRRIMPYAGITTLGTMYMYMAPRKQKCDQEKTVKNIPSPVLKPENNVTLPNELRLVYQKFQQHKAKNNWD